MASHIKVSVVIPTYNSGRYLRETLNSVLEQAGDDTEVVVVDDASTDETMDVLASFRDRVHLLHLSVNNGGPSRPRNLGIQMTTGEYIALFDSDDVMLPGKLKEAARLLDDNREIPLVFTNFVNFWRNGSEAEFLKDHFDFHRMQKSLIRKSWYRLPSIKSYETLIADNFIGTSSVMFRKSLLNAVGAFDETLQRAEDVELWFRITRSFDIGYIDKVYHRRRLHAANISSTPAALTNKLLIYQRQKAAAMSEAGRARLKKMTSKVLFSIGHLNKIDGERSRAIRYYLKSLSYNKKDVRPLVSILKAILPL